jgi:hypothetical protein
VPSVTGHLGDDAPTTSTTNVDPQTILAPGTATIDVIANQANTAQHRGRRWEFEITDPVVGLQGSGTADKPLSHDYIDADRTQQRQD